MVDVSWHDKHCTVKVRITIHAEEGSFSRESTGYEPLPVKGYGDPQSNAESMAFRRAWANWGLGRELYEKDDIDYEVSGDGATTAPPKMRKVESTKKVDVKAQAEEAEEMLDKMKVWVDNQISSGQTVRACESTVQSPHAAQD